jgi:exopolyphosphatase/guanosine-5'-triphosphate,3'-diphosphate pyrophosphatase
VGSNTIHLLVGKVEGGAVLPVTGEKVSARLGAGVEKTGRLDDERLALAAEAITLFAGIAALNGAPSPEILATSAVRDAENGPELVERVREGTGSSAADLRREGGRARFQGRSLGGPARGTGARGGPRRRLRATHPRRGLGGAREAGLAPLGTNRTTERFVEGDPPTDEELGALREHVPQLLPDWDVGEAEVVAVGGSARAMLKITNDGLTVERLWRLSAEVREGPSGVLAREQGLAPERARVLPAAITTLAAILEHFGKEELIVARGGIREGTLLALAEGKGI